MPMVAGTFTSYQAIGNREDLEDRIYNITPDETPLASMIGRKDIDARAHEWQTDSLRTPVINNAQPEGNDYTYAVRSPTVRVKNHTQISYDTLIVSDTQEEVDKAGRKSELGYQMAKIAVEIRKDIEANLLANQASVQGVDNTARVSGGVPSWLTSNDDRGATGADGGYSTGTGLTVAATNGTQRAFSKTILDNVIGQVYISGGNPRIVMSSPYVKQVFSSFMSNANVVPLRRNIEGKRQGVIIAAAEVYVSDFGSLDVIPNRVMPAVGATVARNAFVFTPDMLEIGVLRPFKVDVPAKTGDATKKVLKTEYTLIMKNQAAHGVAADLFGMNAAA